MEVKDLIKQARIQKGMTMKELADKIDVSEATVSRYESGEIASMKHPTIVKLAKALNLHPNVIMGWEDTEQGYYYDPEVAEMANMLKDNPQYRVLFEASRNLKKEDIEFVKSMIDRLKGSDED